MYERDMGIQQEIDRGLHDKTHKLSHGWFFKSAEQLIEECMIGVSKATMQRMMQKLVDDGYLERRNNPKNKMDKVYQYRVNIQKLREELGELGYVMEGFKIVESRQRKQEVQPEPTEDEPVAEQKKTTIRLAECGHVHVKRYAELYAEYKDRAHPNLKHEQYERACKWFDDVQAEFNLFDDQVEDMIHAHFDNLPKSNDGNINAFATGDVAQGPHRKYIGK